MPLDLRAKTVHCQGCGSTQPVAAYISDRDCFAMDMARQVAGNQALKQLRAEGVTCPQCGAKNAVPDDGSVQVPCAYCRTPILLSAFVPADAVARSRLKHGLGDFRHAVELKAKEQARRNLIIVLVVVGVVTAGIIVAGVIGQLR